MGNPFDKSQNAKEVFEHLTTSDRRSAERVSNLERLAASPRLITAVSDQLVVVSSNALTTLHSIPLPRNYLQTKNIVEIYARCLTLNSTGVSENISFFLRYGGSSVTLGAVAFASAATERIVEIHGWLIANGSEISQRLTGKIMVSAPISTFGASLTESGAHSIIAVDSTQDQTISVDVQHTTASGNIQTTLQQFMLGAPITVL